MTIRFDNRVAIVTGAGNGLGRAHALLLASRGAKVVVNDPGGAVDGKGGTHAAADKVVDEIKAAGGQAVANYDSVAEAASAANIVKTAVDSFGTVDIVVNNAGVLRDKTFHNMTIEDLDFVVKVHFLGTAYVTHAAWPILRAKAYGRVVVTSSNSGIYGNFGQANYGGAKLAVVGFMNALRLEGQKYNIMVNALAPVAGTRMTESLMPPEVVAKLKPEYVSPMVAYLCSEQCQR
ncbi:MAG: SDR family oxidoreductase, partial [Alphaproteobacteria bacterium]|nr:SDR family oxidoreductase [Alphaproteobacteria bacterium]